MHAQTQTLSNRLDPPSVVREQLPISESVAQKVLAGRALVRNLGCQVELVNSNAQAADQVVAGEVELCITTEAARESRGLVKLHSFGSPPMVFFYGIAGPSIEVVRKAFAQLNDAPAWEGSPLAEATV